MVADSSIALRTDCAGKARMIFLVGGIAHLIVMFNRNCVGQIVPQLMAEYQTTGVGVTLLSSSYFYAYILGQVPSGAMVAHIGPRRLMTAGLAIASVGTAMFGLASTLSIAVAGRAITGLGLAAIFMCILKGISLWFPPQRFASLSGLSTFIGNTGIIISMFPFVVLANSAGWRGAVLISAAACAGAALLAWKVIRDDGPYDLHPDSLSLCVPSLAREVYEGSREVLCNRGSWPSLIAYGAVFGGLMVFTALWGSPFLTQVHGYTQARAGQMLALSAVAAAIAAPTVGVFVDRIRSRALVFQILASFQVFAWLVILWSSSRPGDQLIPLALPAAIIAIGISNSSFLPSFMSIRSTNRREVSALAQAMNNVFGFLVAIVFQSIVSAIMDSRWSGAYAAPGVRLYSRSDYAAGFMFCLAACVIAIAVGTLFASNRELTEPHCSSPSA